MRQLNAARVTVLALATLLIAPISQAQSGATTLDTETGNNTAACSGPNDPLGNRPHRRLAVTTNTLPTSTAKPRPIPLSSHLESYSRVSIGRMLYGDHLRKSLRSSAAKYWLTRLLSRTRPFLT